MWSDTLAKELYEFNFNKNIGEINSNKNIDEIVCTLVNKVFGEVGKCRELSELDKIIVINMVFLNLGIINFECAEQVMDAERRETLFKDLIWELAENLIKGNKQ